MTISDLLYQFNQSILQSFWGWWAVLLGMLLLGFVLVAFLLVSYRRSKKRKHLWESQIQNIIPRQKDEEVFDLSELNATNWLRRLHAQSRIDIPWKNFVFIVSGGTVLSLLLGIVIGGVLIGLVFGIIFSILVLTLLLTKSLDARKKLVEQLPVFLQAMAHTLQAGYSLQHSFSFVAEEMDEPLRSSIQDINRKLSLQVPLEEVLVEFAESLQHPEIDFFTESTIIQIKTGGNLVVLFQKIAHLIEEKLKLQRDIKSFTSQGKMSGLLIAALWPGSLLVFHWISPSHVGVLFHTTLGNVLLSISIILELIGFFLIWRIVQVKL